MLKISMDILFASCGIALGVKFALKSVVLYAVC
jgi:hypothetical protein